MAHNTYIQILLISSQSCPRSYIVPSITLSALCIWHIPLIHTTYILYKQNSLKFISFHVLFRCGVYVSCMYVCMYVYKYRSSRRSKRRSPDTASWYKTGCLAPSPLSSTCAARDCLTRLEAASHPTTRVCLVTTITPRSHHFFIIIIYYIYIYI